MISIHKEGRKILTIMLVLIVTFNVVALKKYDASNIIYLFISTLCGGSYLFIAYFFRNPKRNIVQHKSHILAPADGKIIRIEEVYEDEYFKDKRLKVRIFMSPLNVHVNRNPISGVIKFFKYHAGRYLVAFHPKSSKKNERTTIVIQNEDGFEILYRQIAGFIARRIKFYNYQGEYVEQGKESGFIKFGSAADIYLPIGTKLLIEKNQKVKGGITLLADISEKNIT